MNLHAFYGEFGGRKVDRDAIEPKHFKNWIAWAKQNGLGLDFNPTCFSHPKASDAFTLSHPDKDIRKFWSEHCIRSREIGAAMGKALGKTCVTNVWIPDGMKDTPADRVSGAAIAKVVKPSLMLALYGIANSVIIVVAMADIKMVSWILLPFSFLFMSVMFPFIFALSIRNLGEQTKIAASFHVMAVGMAGFISAVAMGWLWDNYHSVALSFALPLVGFIATTLYGLAYPALLAKSEQTV